MNDSLLQPEEHVLSTLERDGSRRWLKPRLSLGRWFRWRRALAYALLILYTAIPFIHVDGRPLFLFDLPARRFTLFGVTFLPTDTKLLALAMLGLLLGFFLLTAVIGRVWCGWACPQTVYLEFIFRPIERLFEGTKGKGGPPRGSPSLPRLFGKYFVYAVVCFVVANTFLAYFVGVKTLWEWMHQNPIHHPTPFVIVAAITGLMVFDFAYFREQMCILVCPYGRLQSVLLDQNSLIVAYDARRGEPRGKVKDKERHPDTIGDCVDCGRCVVTCPTGIDIRQGLQMECINCTQCIDACDDVMERLGRPKNLIRYSSIGRDQGGSSRLIRARTIIYPALLTLVAGMFVVTLMGKRSFDAVLLRNQGQPFTVMEDGTVRNVLRLKLTSRTPDDQSIRLEVVHPEGVEVHGPVDGAALPGEATDTVPLTVLAPPGAFEGGQAQMTLRLASSEGDTRQVSCKLLGPMSMKGRTP